jgi:uncharacterized iron-regulated protein
MKRPAVCAAYATLTLLGCARANQKPIGYSMDVETAPAPETNKPKHAHKPVAKDAVLRAQRGFSGKRQSDGQWLPQAALQSELARYDVICFGEQHDQVEHHYAEYALLLGLSRRTAASGRELGLGLEMFEREAGSAIDAYVAGKLSEQEFLERTSYEDNWGFPFAYYAPLFEVAQHAGLRVLGLNARRELTHKLARGGFDALSEEERRALPELDFEDTEHRALFDAAMAHHPKGHGSMENMYAAQVVWDETMAESATKWVSAHAPARQLFIAAGAAHCAARAIPARIKRRVALSVVNITPSSSDKAAKGYDYALVFE